MELTIAIATFKQAMINNPDLMDIYATLISNSFIDEVMRHELHISGHQFKEIALNGARNFLREWVGMNEAPMIKTLESIAVVEEQKPKPNKKK